MTDKDRRFTSVSPTFNSNGTYSQELRPFELKHRQEDSEPVRQTIRRTGLGFSFDQRRMTDDLELI